MKRIIYSLALLLLLCNTSNAQQSSASNTINEALKNADHFFVPAIGQSALTGIPDKANNPDYQLYKRRSRTMRITGLSLLGAGLASGVIALVSSSNYESKGYYDDDLRHDRTVTTLFIISAAAGVASIPFMVLAHVNNNKARASLSSQKAYIPGKGDTYITGLSVSLNIGK